MVDFKDDIEKMKREAHEVMKFDEVPKRAIVLINDFCSLLEIMGDEVKRSNLNRNDFSGDVRIIKAKYEQARSELSQNEKIRVSLISAMSKAIKSISASAHAINASDSSPVEAKGAADSVLNECKKLIGAISEGNKAA